MRAGATTRRIAPGATAAAVALAAAAIAAAPAGASGGAPPAGGAAAQPPGPAIVAPSRAQGATLARIIAPTRARRRLDGRGRSWPVSTQTAWSGQSQVLLVLDAAVRDGRAWIRVLLAIRPAGISGWVPRDHVQLSRTRYWLEIHTRARTVSVYHDGARVRRFRAVVGAAGTPTPRGLAAIYEHNRQPDPDAFLGPWVLPLTALSDTLTNFGGGPGRVGIHGRGRASLGDPLGSARSHGCIRIPNSAITYLARTIPNGTPVQVG